jgi:hypothetical protein
VRFGGSGEKGSSSSVFHRWTKRASTAALFAALTAVMTWPQVLLIGTHAADHHDVFFNLWRLRWVAHALANSPERLFQGNVFHPSRSVLAFSDAMLVEGVVAAPFFWLGLPPVLVHNLLLLGAIAASGVGMFVLARHLSGSSQGAIVAGVVYSFAPYRFEHYMHMELQWAVWVPWAFWALQRTIETRAAKYGALTGVFVALQLLSSIYYAAFLAVLLPAVALLQLLAFNGRAALSVIRVLVIGAVIAGGVSAMYAKPYAQSSSRVGIRSETEVTTYSAKPKDYLAATPGNLLYGERSHGRAERRLFPGSLAPLLAVLGLLLLAPRPATLAYLVGGVIAFELSLGMYGYTYPFLYEHVEAFQSLRAPARASIFVLLFLGVLAAQGYAAISAFASRRWRLAPAIVLIPLLLAEYWVAPLKLIRYRNEPPALYSWLSQQPPGIVAEFPMPPSTNLPGRDAMYSYMSTFHWKPLLNGYSGYYPRYYIDRLDRLETFPEPQAIEHLRNEDVTYVVVHAETYSSAEFEHIIEALSESSLEPLGRFDSGNGAAAVFRLP